MRFGKQYEFYKIPEWSEFYFDYKGVKLLLKFLDKRKSKKKTLKKLKRLKTKLERVTIEENNDNENQNNEIKTDSNEPNDIMGEKYQLIPLSSTSSEKNVKNKLVLETEDLSKFSKEEKVRRFIFIYRGKIDFVEQFFMRKLEEFVANLDKMKTKISEQRKNLTDEEKLNMKRTTEQLNAERDEMGYAVSWKRALSALYNETSWLHSYHLINFLAIQKIEKKIKKIFKINKIDDLENKLIELHNEFSFFSTALDKLVELRKKIKKLYSEEFASGDEKKASAELERRLQGSGKIKHTRLIFFYIGIISGGLLFFLALFSMKPENNKSIAPFFPAFNFGLVIIESMIGVAGVIAVLKKYRVNYVYILEIEPKDRLGPPELFQNAFMMLAVWTIILVMMKLALNFGLFYEKFSLFSLLINAFLIVFLFLPFHIMYYSFRKGIVKVLIRNFFPIGKNTVRFKDFLFGDILTSLNKPFASLILGYCLMACKDCEDNNERGGCNRESIACLIVLFYPFFIRFTQCINRYYYTRQAWPHLGNSLKYVGGFSNAVCAWLYSRFKTKEALYVHIAAGVVSQSYMLFWDIYVDWGLGRCDSDNFLLRKTIVYPKKAYYLAILFDAILRFSWTWNFIPLDKSYDEWKNLVTSLLEAYRRIQWCVFRIENEYWTNPENYRAILVIPELPPD